MRIFSSLESFRKWRQAIPPKSSIGFVPTMGALHLGHLSLIKRARKENRETVVSIFVNPIQFGPKEDLKRYPKPWHNDVALLKNLKVSALLAPSPRAMYPDGFRSHVFVSDLSEHLCGSPQSRGSEHFIGVATVVAKLFNIVRPTRAYFGLKDFQQVRVIEQMNEDLNFGIQIVRCPTVREADGLAMSSRNTYLKTEERQVAPLFYHALQCGRKLLTSDPRKTPQQVKTTIRKSLLAIPNVKIDYVELVNPMTLTDVLTSKKPILIAAAIQVSSTRLIDNIIVK